MDKAAAEALHENMFLKLLRRFADAGRLVGHKKGPTFAPAVFANTPEAMEPRIKSKMFEAAMERLFEKKAIVVEQYGRPSRPNWRVTACNMCSN